MFISVDQLGLLVFYPGDAETFDLFPYQQFYFLIEFTKELTDFDIMSTECMLKSNIILNVLYFG